MAEVSLALPDRTGQPLGVDLWGKALQRLSEQDKQCIDLHADKRTVLVDLLNTVTERQQVCVGKQWKYTKRNGDVVFVRDALAGVFDGIKRFQQIGDVAIQYDPAHAALPWAGIRLLLKIAINDHEMHAAMVDGVEQVSRLIVRYAIVESMYLKPSAILQDQLRECIVELYVAVLTYLAKARSYYDRGTGARISRAIVQSSSGVEKQLAIISERARRVDEVVGLIEADCMSKPYVQSPTNGLVTRMRARFMAQGFGEMKDGFAEVEHGLHGMNERLKGFAEKLEPLVDTFNEPPANREKLLTWLNAVFTDEEWETSLRARTPGTCTWILERLVFQEWVEGERKQLLWIHGSLGFGKTVLSAYIVDHLQRLQPNHVAYFFCTSDSEAKRQPLAIVRSWVAQLITHPEVLDAVRDGHHGKEGRPAATTADVWQIFRRICEKIDCFFVVDGLDECTESRQIPQFLSELRMSACRVLVVSRPHTDIRAGFRRLVESGGICEYEIVPADTEGDITAFSTSMVASRLPKKSDLLKEEMAREASQRSQSIFLWVRLLGDRLDPTENTKELRKIVREMPKEIEEAYASELRRIEELPRHREHAIAVLRWTLFAQRPLTIREITEALAVEDHDEDNFPADNLPDSWTEDGVDDRIQRLCGSLILLKGREEQRPPPEQTVHFVHFSVREYLSTGVSSSLTFIAAREHDLLAQICLRYMCYPEVVSEEHYSEEMISQKVQKYGFLNYAAHFWFVHARVPDWSPELTALANILFEPASRRWILWSRIAGDELVRASSFCNVIDAANNSGDVSSLYYACLLGFLPSINHLLEQGHNVNASGGPGTPLHGAVVGGHTEAVKVLLKHDAKVNAQTPTTGMTPMHYAAIDGRYDITKLLLMHGADAGISNYDGIAPMQSAAYFTYSDIVKLLLGQGEHDDLQDKNNLTPLHYAAFSGHTGIVQQLIVHGAKISASDSDGMTPLYYAILGSTDLTGEHIAVVELLIAQGGDLNAPRLDGRTPLHAAAYIGHLELVQYLLKSGANVHAREENGSTPLSLGVQTKLNTVQALVEQGADVNIIDQVQETPLHRASAAGNVEIVSYLLEHGADMGARNSHKQTPLHLAASHCNDTTEHLLKAGADVMSESSEAFTPLHFAAAYGKVKVAEVLLRYGATIDARSADKYTPLHSACVRGELEMARWLLEHGADVNANNSYGETSLHCAVRSGDAELTKLLVANNAAADTRPTGGFTALHIAAAQGHEEIVEMLADRGAQVSLQTSNGATPLQTAAYAGHASIVGNLLKRGADGTVVDSFGGSVSDWIAANPKIFPGLEAGPMTSSTIRTRALHTSIVHYIQSLINKQNDSDWDLLGRYLLRASDLEAARSSFVHATRLKNKQSTYSIYCDLCDGIDTELMAGSRFVCRTCPNVDLCPKCLPKYPKPERLPGCIDHEFLEIREPDDEAVDASPDAVSKLLNSLLTRYNLDNETQETQTIETK